MSPPHPALPASSCWDYTSVPLLSLLHVSAGVQSHDFMFVWRAPYQLSYLSSPAPMLSTLLFCNPHCIVSSHQPLSFHGNNMVTTASGIAASDISKNWEKASTFLDSLLRMTRHFPIDSLVRIILPNISDHMHIRSHQFKIVGHI